MKINPPFLDRFWREANNFLFLSKEIRGSILEKTNLEKISEKGQEKGTISMEKHSVRFHEKLASKKLQKSSFKSEDIWNELQLEDTKKIYGRHYESKEGDETAREIDENFKRFNDFVLETKLADFEDPEKLKYLSQDKYYKNLSGEEKIKFLHEVKGLRIDQEILKSPEVRVELEKEKIDQKALNKAVNEYVKANKHLEKFYHSYQEVETVLQEGNEAKLQDFEKASTPILKESTHSLGREISGMGGTLNITSVRSHKGNVALFAKDKIPMGGDAALCIYLSSSGKGIIEGERGSVEELFDPKMEGDFGRALKNMRYRAMAFYSAQQSQSLHNFDENISSNMLGTFIQHFEKDIRSNVSPEEKFVLLCKQWGMQKEVQLLGIGKWMKNKFFNDSEILSLIEVEKAQNEIVNLLKKEEQELNPNKKLVRLEKAQDVGTEKIR